jgi:anti-anti-sigma factor
VICGYASVMEASVPSLPADDHLSGRGGPASSSADLAAGDSPLPVPPAGGPLVRGQVAGLRFCTAHREAGLIRVSGEIDMPDAERLTDWIVEQVAVGVTHLDLSDVSYCGAAGVRMLMAARDAVSPGGTSLRLTCSPLVLRVLTICGLTEMERLTVAAAEAKNHPSQELS